MADAKITALTALTSVAGEDLLAIVDDPGGTPITKYTTVEDLLNYAVSSANTSVLSASGYSLTGTSAVSALEITGTWNTTGAPSAIKLSITNTASDAASRLLDLAVGGTSEFIVEPGPRVGIGITDPASTLHVIGEDVGSNTYKAITIENPVDDDFYAAISIKAGATATQRRYLEWLGYDGTRTHLFGYNAVGSMISYDATNQYHPLIIDHNPVGSVRLNGGPGAGTVIIGQDTQSGNAVGSGGLNVYDGSINSSHPRNTYARINSVGIQSYNGKYIESYSGDNTVYIRQYVLTSAGSDIITNGTFATDTDWTKGTGWTISGGVADAGGGSASLTQAVTLTSGTYYQVTYTISSISTGSITAQLQGGTTVSGNPRAATGTYIEYLLAGASSNTIAFTADACDATIDNVILKPVTGNKGYIRSASSPTAIPIEISPGNGVTIFSDGSFSDRVTFDCTNETYDFVGDVSSTGDVSSNTFTAPRDGELTIATGAITATGTYHTVDTEGNAASDDLDTISGGTDGRILIIRPASTARTVVAKDATGNLQLAGDFTMDNDRDMLTLIYDGTLSAWIEVSRSDNGA